MELLPWEWMNSFYVQSQLAKTLLANTVSVLRNC